MKRLKLISIVAVLLLLAAPAAMAQVGDGYGPNRNTTYPQEVQTTNSPAGTAVEPGSQLLFLLDSGIDAEAEGLVGTMRQNGITAPRFTNFISITNVNPTDAVTVHFRYYNEECTDLLDFLVLLTCNDTMLLDAFNFLIPGTSTNVSQRFFGELGPFPAPIDAARWASGRFLLFVVASGAVGNDSGFNGDTSPAGDRGDFDDPEDLDKFADWLIPENLSGQSLLDECTAVDEDTIGFDDPVTGAINDNNLNIFNASAISFNYLTGFHTVAAIRNGGLASYGVTAWTRPAVNLATELNPEDTSESPDQVPDFSPQDVVGPNPMGNPFTPKSPDGIFDAFDLYNLIDAGLDGDGPLAPKRCVLAGSEEIWLTLKRNSALVLPANYFYLRQDAHGGDTVETNCEGLTGNSLRCDGTDPFFRTPVQGGALGWTLFDDSAVIPSDQYLFGLSIKDDYNGSNNPFINPASFADDSAYRVDPAATYYELQIYDNEEELLRIDQQIPPISPQPDFTPVITRVGLKCLDYFNFENQNVQGASPGVVPGGAGSDFVYTNDLNTFSVADLFALAPAVPGHLDCGKCDDLLPDLGELGPGWIRFNRIVTRDYFYLAGPASPAPNGALISERLPYDGERGTYVTIAKNIIFQSAFGVSFYLPQAATAFAP